MVLSGNQMRSWENVPLRWFGPTDPRFIYINKQYVKSRIHKVWREDRPMGHAEVMLQTYTGQPFWKWKHAAVARGHPLKWQKARVWQQPTCQEFCMTQMAEITIVWQAQIFSLVDNIEHATSMTLCCSFSHHWFLLCVVLFYKSWKKIIFEGKSKPTVYYMKKSNYGREEWVSSSVLFCDRNSKQTYKLKINASLENSAFLSFRLHQGFVLEHRC